MNSITGYYYILYDLSGAVSLCVCNICQCWDGGILVKSPSGWHWFEFGSVSCSLLLLSSVMLAEALTIYFFEIQHAFKTIPEGRPRPLHECWTKNSVVCLHHRAPLSLNSSPVKAWYAIGLTYPIQNTVVQCIELQGNRCGPGRRHLNIRGL